MKLNRREFGKWVLRSGLLVPVASFGPIVRAQQIVRGNSQSAKSISSGGGSTFVNDTMTGSDSTDLTSHTGETGATWAKVTGVTGVIKITSNKCKGDSGGHSAYYASGTPTTAEYNVQADFTYISDVDELGICGRMATGAETFYIGWYDKPNNGWKISKVSGGTFTTLGTYASSFSSGTVAVKLEIRDASKKLYLDGVLRITDSSDNTITSAGKAGIWYNNSDWGFGSTGRTIDNFQAINA